MFNIFPKVEIFYLFHRIIISSIFFSQWKYLFIKLHDTIKNDSHYPNDFKELYVSFYLTFLLSSTFILNLGFMQLVRIAHWYLAIICLIFMVAIAFYSPYPTKLDNMAIFMANLLMVSFFCWRVLRQSMQHLIVNEEH